MPEERTVPLLPCASVDDIERFYLMLGFEVTYRQRRPNPYLALRRGGIELHHFGIDGFDPEQSYGSCLVVVPDTGALFDAFAAGLRAGLGKLPLTGIPRITRPRRRRNAGNVTGFSVVDPGGNWIRVVRAADGTEQAPEGKLALAVANAVVLADSHGDVAQAAKILVGALDRAPSDGPVAGRAEALSYLAELHVRNGDTALAAAALTQLDDLAATDADRATIAPYQRQTNDLRHTPR